MATILNLRDAASRLGTYPKRIRDLVDATGITPQAIGPSLVITEEQFGVIAARHAVDPPRPVGRPRSKAGPARD